LLTAELHLLNAYQHDDCTRGAAKTNDEKLENSIATNKIFLYITLILEEREKSYPLFFSFKETGILRVAGMTWICGKDGVDMLIGNISEAVQLRVSPF